MFDFLYVSTRSPKRGVTEVYPKFKVMKSKDLMIRGNRFYAIWDDENKIWATDEYIAIKLIDKEIEKVYKKLKGTTEDTLKALYLWDTDSKQIVKWHNYIKNDMIDNYHILDQKIIFSNTEVKKTDYASKKLNYPLQKGPIDAYNELMSTLYSPENRKKIEWAIGAIVCGDSKKIHKFLVLYGSGGTGKSTVLKIIKGMFEGYYSTFDAKSLGSSNHQFSLEPFRDHPLVAIQTDGNLSKIDDNAKLNTLVAHEDLVMNIKHMSAYTSKFNTFLFMGSNKPVKITDAKSGLIRRLIDVAPTGNLVETERYFDIISRIEFEYGAIAYHCLNVYKKNKRYYDSYVPIAMLSATNDFYNFLFEQFEKYRDLDGISLKEAWDDYDEYCKNAKLNYPLNQRNFKEELKNYFHEYYDRKTLSDGTRVRSYYEGFITSKFQFEEPKEKRESANISKNDFGEYDSEFDKVCGGYLTQYGNDEEKPKNRWVNVKTKLADIDTSKLHYVLLPENHIVIDFDLKDENGKKSFEKNLEAASKFPETYGEISKSGGGIHLHYIYDGDVSKLEKMYDEDIEIKVFKGNQSLRRKLTLCNRLPIRHINSGLPLKKEETKSIGEKEIKSDIKLREMIERNINKDFHGHTKPNMDFIKKILDDAYKSDLIYDISDMYDELYEFAEKSSNNSSYCIDILNQLKLRSKSPFENIPSPKDGDIVIFDCEVFPNLLIICFKIRGRGNPVHVLVNPSPQDIEKLLRYKLVGFNCRKYDNHILHARRIGRTLYRVYLQSKKIIDKMDGAFFGVAYNYSYTDILDFASKKQGLKKYEIELWKKYWKERKNEESVTNKKIQHKELALPWDEPVDRSLWNEVIEYCKNDVLATEEVFEELYIDFKARKGLADISGGTENDTTNTLTTKLIFGDNKNPQNEFNYRFLGDDPRFKGYTFEWNNEKKKFLSLYKGYEVGEGGFVFAVPGMYDRVVTFDVASMHPSSIIAENLFGDRYTKIFKELVETRKAIKHKDYELAGKMFGGKFKPYLGTKDDAKQISNALKIAINSVYGLTAASFPNPFRDERNKDNIVAKRGALFMVNLLEELKDKGATVIHIKTDSIKVVDPTPDISDFIIEYGLSYGYEFEIEHIFEKICLVNDAVYIAKCAEDDPEKPGEWEATGTQFAVPYVKKTLFTHEPIEFIDLCETKSVTTSIYLDMNEGYPDVTMYEKELEKIRKELIKKGKESTEKKEWTPYTTEFVDALIYEDPHREAWAKWLKQAEIEVPEVLEQIQDLRRSVEAGHNYIFVGRVGLFTPIKKGCGGGLIRRLANNGKYSAVSGTKDYRWMESEVVENLQKQDDIDMKYYEKLAQDAKDAISKYGDYETFAQ